MQSTSSPSLRSEDGFTLVELLLVLAIMGILLALAVPSYLGLSDRAANSAAKANLRAAMPAAEAYYADNLSYAGMTAVGLRNIDAGISKTLTVASATPSSYCVAETVGGQTWSAAGPGAPLTNFVPNATCS